VANGSRIPAARALKQPEVTLEQLVARCELPFETTDGSRLFDLASTETEFRYEGYLRRQFASIERLRRQESRSIPDAFPFASIPGLSREMVQRLGEVRPATLAQASRIPGVTPAAVAVVAAYLDRRRPLGS
jgi:tRNA uridine 5-carboxymethylaminomethyl modification enzyme